MPEQLSLLGSPDEDERPIEGGHTATAVISDCGHYRYDLTRAWGPGSSRVLWVMLNPSTADARILDPTLRRCLGFSKAWGYDGMTIRNVFAYRSPEPLDLLAVADPVGPQNDAWLGSAGNVGLTIVGWGAGSGRVKKLLARRVPDVLAALHDPHALALTKDGDPRHPLYLPGDLRPVPYAA